MLAFSLAAPEVLLLIALCVVLLLDSFLAKNEAPLIAYLAAQLSLWATALMVYSLTFSRAEKVVGLERMYIVDEIGGVLKIAILVITSVGFVYARKYLREHQMWRGEFYVLGLSSVLGMLIMVSGYNLLSLYLGVELLSLSMYALVAFRRDDPRASEAAMKYFVLGAVASGLLLYGMSMLYGLSGTLSLDGLKDYFTAQGMENHVMLIFALSFLVAGLAFKLGVVPFHMWLPDVYQGAPTAVTLLLSSAPKIATLALLIRILVDGLSPALASWSQLLMVFGLLSVVLGNIVAIAQTSLKRMLAYSAISHMGFILLAVLTGTEGGYSAALFYSIIYALMSSGAFAILILLGNHHADPDHLDCLRGLNQRSPWFALLMLIILFSMAGIPPTAGFYAKLAVIDAIMAEGYWIAAIVLVVMSVIGAYYYLRAIKLMYFDEPEESLPIVAGLDFKVTLGLNSLSMIILGMFPGLLMAVCASAVKASQLL